MKKIKMLVVSIIAVMLMGSMALPVMAAAKSYKNELVKVKIKGSDPVDYNIYYYDKSGNKVKNAWQKVEINGVEKTFYFGNNGKAYKAPANKSFKYDVITRVINGKRYGFDMNGYLLTGLHMSAGFGTGKFHYFNKDGTMNNIVTRAFRNAAAQGADSAKLQQLIRTYEGKPKETIKTNVCTRLDDVDPLYGTIVKYKRFEVQYFMMPGNKEVVYIAVSTLRLL